MTPDKLTMRPRAIDLVNLDAIVDALRARGERYATRSGALRLALAETAAALAPPTEAKPGP